MMDKKVEKFIELVSEKSQFQEKYFANWSISDEEMKELSDLITFYENEMGYDIEYIADCYIFLNNMIMEETYYFKTNGRYRYSTFEEVEDKVYANPDYMSRYMCGLTISDYIWNNHIEMVRFYREILNDEKGVYSSMWGGGIHAA
jgi:hypothetical protein